MQTRHKQAKVVSGTKAAAGTTTNTFTALDQLSLQDSQQAVTKNNLQMSMLPITTVDEVKTSINNVHTSGNNAHSGLSVSQESPVVSNQQELSHEERINETLTRLENEMAAIERSILDAIDEDAWIEEDAAYKQKMQKYIRVLQFTNERIARLSSSRYEYWLEAQNEKKQWAFPTRSHGAKPPSPIVRSANSNVQGSQGIVHESNSDNMDYTEDLDDDDANKSVNSVEDTQQRVCSEQGRQTSSSCSALPPNTGIELFQSPDPENLFDHVVQISDGKGMGKCNDFTLKNLPVFKPTALTVFFLNFEMAVHSMSLSPTKLASILWVLLENEIHTRTVVSRLLWANSTWGTIKREVRELYTRVDEKTQAINELMRFQMQPGISFNTYRNDFQVLTNAARADPNAPHMLAQFIANLAEPLKTAAIRDFISQGVYPELHQRYNFNSISQYLYQLEQFVQPKTSKTPYLRNSNSVQKLTTVQKHCVHHPNSTSHNTADCIKAKAKVNTATSNSTSTSSTTMGKAPPVSNNNVSAAKNVRTNTQQRPLCYKCGDLGHYKSSCSNTANPKKVNDMLDKMTQANEQKLSPNQSN